METSWPTMFSEVELNGVSLRNRVVQLPMGLHFTEDGQPTDDDVAYYEARAQGGVALIITGGTVVHRSQVATKRELYEAFDPAHIPAFARLAEAVHRQGAKIFGEIMHNGREPLARNPDWPTYGPSAIAPPGIPIRPQELSIGRIQEIIQGFADSARNLLEAGYDGIEVHGAHGFLVAQFLSALSNLREDRYGGDFENRMTFLLEIIEAIRSECGTGFPLGVRISGEEGLEGGISIEDNEILAKRLADTGSVDYLSVTIGVRGSFVRDMATPHGIAVPLASRIRAAGGLPVVVGQRLTQPALAESILVSGQADLIGLARALIADPEWVLKAQTGRSEEIRPCVGLNEACRMGAGALAASRGGPIACNHNPVAGRERELGDLRPVARGARRRVLVVGGGPAGLEAALVAASLGHLTKLVEAQQSAGGQVRIASNAPTRAEMEGVVSYRVSELHRLGVPLEFGAEATVESILAESPDVVVLATGSRPAVAPIPGADLPIVMNVFELLDPQTPSDRWSGVERAVVIDDGSGGWETCSSAEFLAERGVMVTIVTPAASVGASIPQESIGPLYQRFARRKVQFVPLTAPAEIEEDGVVLYRPHYFAATRSLDESRVTADLIVLYSGKESYNPFGDALTSHISHVTVVGDCSAPRRITEAVLAARRTALTI